MNVTVDMLDEAVQALAESLAVQRWFAQKDRSIRKVVRLDESIDAVNDVAIALTVCEVVFDTGKSERYFCPFVLSLHHLESNRPALRKMSDTSNPIWIYDGLTTAFFGEWLRIQLLSSAVLSSSHGAFRCHCLDADALRDAGPARTVQFEQSNSSMLFGNELIAKIYRRFVTGQNPEIEIGEALLRIGATGVAPRPVGWMDYVGEQGSGATAMVQELIPSTGDLWSEVTATLVDPELIRSGSWRQCRHVDSEYSSGLARSPLA